MTDESVPEPSVGELERARDLRRDLSRLMMEYRFAVDEVLTKVTILREEFLHLHRYNPIEHVSSRVKSAPSIVAKMARKAVAPDADAIRAAITDIAGVRITCSFIEDTYRVLETLVSQDDVRVMQIKDYIAHPKPNGYKSIHAIIEIPVFLSTGAVQVPVELQIRTIAMDFWASLEHKIHYKFDGEVPDHLAESLSDAAVIAERLDVRMEELHREVHGTAGVREESPSDALDDAVLAQLWKQLNARQA
ncbi:GTP pyrophosphokinase [Demequina globuliformis]|uniref:GTP pyrophosphokinase n=1 Tax=Demequina globuliformis TaxID=676202 RepID=UPI000B0F8E70